MNVSGDAAEKVVRMSLEGTEYAIRIAGSGSIKTAMLLATILKQETKTKGKTRLTGMLKSGKELKVFTVQQKDLAKFSKEAKRYGVLYCVLKDKGNKNPNAPVDVIARAEDASKIQRITERFKLATVETETVINSTEKDRVFPEKEKPEKTADELERGKRIMKPLQKEENAVNPAQAKTEKSPPSEPNSKQTDRSEGSTGSNEKASVREKLERYRKEGEANRDNRGKEVEKSKNVGNRSTKAPENTPRKPKRKEKAR